MKKGLLAGIIGLSMMFAHAAHAEMLTVGQIFPKETALLSPDAKSATFEDFAGEQGTVLLFVRSIDWCGYCQKQIKSWSKRATEFNEFGYNIVSISYDEPEALAAFNLEYSVNLALYSDMGSKLIKQLGILNKDVAESSKAYGIPHPTILLLDADGKVTDIFQHAGYKQRPEIDSVLAAVAE